MNGRRKARKAHHGGEHDVNRVGLDNFVKRLCSGIDLHVGQVLHEVAQLAESLFVGNDHGSRMVLMGLFGQQFHLVVSCQAVHFIQVAMLLDDFEGLRPYAASGAEDGYLLFPFHYVLLFICFTIPATLRANAY